MSLCAVSAGSVIIAASIRPAASAADIDENGSSMKCVCVGVAARLVDPRGRADLQLAA